MHTTASPSAARAGDLPRAVPAAAGAILLGLFILFGVGFAGSATLHNVAHDTRHSFSFPCH